MNKLLTAAALAADNPFASLTPAEMAVITLLTQGKKAKEIASSRGISPRTVEAHILNARRKYRARSNYHLAAKVVRDQEQAALLNLLKKYKAKAHDYSESKPGTQAACIYTRVWAVLGMIINDLEGNTPPELRFDSEFERMDEMLGDLVSSTKES